MAESNQHTIDMGVSMETEEGLAIIDALNEVSDVLAMAGPRVTFTADAPARLGEVGRLRAVDVYTCPRGTFVFMQEREGPHWAVAAETPTAAVEAIHEDDIREQVRQGMTNLGLL